MLPLLHKNALSHLRCYLHKLINLTFNDSKPKNYLVSFIFCISHSGPEKFTKMKKKWHLKCSKTLTCCIQKVKKILISFKQSLFEQNEAINLLIWRIGQKASPWAFQVIVGYTGSWCVLFMFHYWNTEYIYLACIIMMMYYMSTYLKQTYRKRMEV